jgi:hypothetical protein
MFDFELKMHSGKVKALLEHVEDLSGMLCHGHMPVALQRLDQPLLPGNAGFGLRHVPPGQGDGCFGLRHLR